MECYFQGCTAKAATREHIPPKSFFPEDQRNQLLTVGACHAHNGEKSKDDTYVLAHICMNASPSNGARGVFFKRVAPQLGYNDDALRKLIAADARTMDSGAVAYKVDIARFDQFFDALTCGILMKAGNQRLPENYKLGHTYHAFKSHLNQLAPKIMERFLFYFYSGNPSGSIEVGKIRALNASIYTAKLFGIPSYRSSITVVHVFYGSFRVTSMVSLMRDR